jgi:hypothetical protein
MDVRPFFFLNFKGTSSQEAHKTILATNINQMALSDPSDFPPA